MNGNHRDTGILLLSEPAHGETASLLDVAPTVLAVLGVPGPPMEGTPLLGAASGPTDAPPPGEETGYSLEESRLIEARLRKMGYLE